jgi:hypothetical protein
MAAPPYPVFAMKTTLTGKKLQAYTNNQHVKDCKPQD